MRGGRQGVANADVRGQFKQNLLWSFIYNSIGVPIAALGFLNPMIARAAMALPSLSVIVNSALRKRVKLDRDAMP